MPKKKNKKLNKKTSIYLILPLIIAVSFLGIWKIIDEDYDKQNKIILFLKELVPQKISRKIRDTIFIIPDLKTINKDLTLQLTKYEQGLDGKLFSETEFNLKTKKAIYKKFFLPFPRLNVRAGYLNPTNSTRAHYLEVIGDKVLVISGLGQTIFFEKKNIFKDKLEQKEISNNIDNLMVENNIKFIGLRDIFVEAEKVYISLLFQDEKGYSFNIYSADLNYEKLNFEIFFETKTYFKKWSVSTGGRIEKFKNNKILFTYGHSQVRGSPQDKNSLLGKIISIDLNTKNYDLVSLGHRNPQGLVYDKDLSLVINAEHGPKGGDEINLNFLKENKIPNYGFDVVSYGIEYNGTDPYKRGKTKKPHIEFGFEEPFIYYVPSIGISEIVFLNKKKSFLKKNSLFVSSLRAGSIYVYELNDKLNKVEKEDRIYFGNERIRDLEYDSENEVFFIIDEITPSIGVLKFKD
jgi:glucose/arabinose dehydrogenase